jgi:hypothetical protein
VVNLGGLKPSYLGPPESYRNVNTGSVPSASSTMNSSGTSSATSPIAQNDVPWNVPPLKDAFKGKFLIGTALNYPALQGKAPMDVAITTRHFDAITAGNSMKPDVPAAHRRAVQLPRRRPHG